ncbi:sugar-binding domain-containing protein [Mucilaginibacter aquatilis]|uniref:DUF4982 domain-containing protein n=1 Tax=Mucilaginibacter aquatilis TaxID=1517760 RepID=A0A6I4I8A7_9SPHI|nr:sugar-binding domain-containing protein [Mucilaginibacter aquatilis]MVN91292.1 DUF4982 domain-containing protein [Mucilaginibacter aquatilis]
MKKHQKLLLLMALALPVTFNVNAQNQNGTLFNDGWKFHKGEIGQTAIAQTNGADWKTVSIPHDWSIEEPFSDEWPSATGYLPGGIGWYQKSFTVPLTWKSKVVSIYFDGVYKNSEVYLNGKLLGKRPNGFIPFEYELNKHLKYGTKNTITVKADHSQFADSRWYTGSGIYRNVYLKLNNPLYIAKWGVKFFTPKVSRSVAEANVEVTLVNKIKENTTINIISDLRDANGMVVASSNQKLFTGNRDSIKSNLSLKVKSPQLWSVNDPNLYQLSVQVKMAGKVISSWKDKVGIRNIRFDAGSGFYLNDKNLKLKGVCIHDDAGALGVAVPEGVWVRRLKLLKEAGCNSIRMSHNPHADYLYRLCDQMGFLVMDEAFDEWEFGKNKWVKGWNVGTPSNDGYHSAFKEWASIDVRDMVLRNFNRPSIIMWSIGNEIDYPNDPYTHEVLNSGRNPQIYGKGFLSDHPSVSRLSALSKQLAGAVKKFDTSRPVTAALAGVVMSNTTDYPANLDIVGYNYQEYRYADDHKAYPKRIIYGSENGMQLSAWNAVDSNQYISAQYLWTGIDYLGEAGRWPERSNRAGLLDLAGFRKPEYYFRQSIWATKPMIYIGTTAVPKGEDKGIWSHKRAEPNWNWKEGDMVRLNCFTNCENAELFVNGKSMGKKAKQGNNFIWWDIPFEEGEVKAIGNSNGNKQVEYVLKSSGSAYGLQVSVESDKAGSENRLSHLIIRVVDKNGIPVYDADNEITVTVSENGKLLGLESGSSSSHENYKGTKRKALHGNLLAYIQSLKNTGNITVDITSPALKSITISIK